jgi:hypothetical protein
MPKLKTRRHKSLSDYEPPVRSVLIVGIDLEQLRCSAHQWAAVLDQEALIVCPLLVSVHAFP